MYLTVLLPFLLSAAWKGAGMVKAPEAFLDYDKPHGAEQRQRPQIALWSPLLSTLLYTSKYAFRVEVTFGFLLLTAEPNFN